MLTALGDCECAFMLAGLDQVVQKRHSTWHKALLVSSNSAHTLNMH